MAVSQKPLIRFPYSQSPAFSVFRLLSQSPALSAICLLSVFGLLSIFCFVSVSHSLSVVHSQPPHSRSLHFRSIHCRSLHSRSRSLSLSLRSLSAFFVWAKGSFFISFSFEKRVKVALLSDCSCKRMFFFFCLLNDLRVKFWFLCDFWWKMKSFWLFHCSVLDLKRFLRLGFDFFWF